jgi:hypothetical protein
MGEAVALRDSMWFGSLTNVLALLVTSGSPMKAKLIQAWKRPGGNPCQGDRGDCSLHGVNGEDKQVEAGLHFPSHEAQEEVEAEGGEGDGAQKTCDEARVTVT